MIFNKVSKSVILKDMLLKKGKFNFGNLVGTDTYLVWNVNLISVDFILREVSNNLLCYDDWKCTACSTA